MSTPNTPTESTTPEDDISAVLGLEGRELDAACARDVMDYSLKCGPSGLYHLSNRDPIWPGKADIWESWEDGREDEAIWANDGDKDTTPEEALRLLCPHYCDSLDRSALLRAELARRGLMERYVEILMALRSDKDAHDICQPTNALMFAVMADHIYHVGTGFTGVSIKDCVKLCADMLLASPTDICRAALLTARAAKRAGAWETGT